MSILLWPAVIVIAAGFYRISLSIWPYTRCPRCDGSGRNAGSNRKRFGNCRKCDGSGRRERLGVRLFLRSRDD